MSALPFTAVLFAISSLFLLVTMTLSPSSRWVPLLVALPTAALLGVQLIKDLKKRAETKSVTPSENSALLWVLCLPLAVYLFGFLLAVPVFLLAFARLRSHSSWVSAVTPMLIAILSLIFLQFFLKVELFGGLLWKSLA